MPAFTFYWSVFVLAATVASAALAAVSFAVFRHRSALWLTVLLVGLGWFAVTVVVAAVEAWSGLTVGVPGLRLLWQALGSVFLVHALPRFALAAFGAPGWWGRLGWALTAATAALSALRVASGWNDARAVLPAANAGLEGLLYAVIGGTLVATLVFQSRLPYRGLYRAVVAQTALVAVLVPLVVLEDLGVFRVPGLPLLAGQTLLLVTAAFAASHIVSTLLRPRYMAGPSPSPYFVEHFGLSPRELDVVAAVLEGLSNKDMADKLFISPRTVEKHLSNVYQKLGIKSRLQLVNLLRSEA